MADHTAAVACPLQKSKACSNSPSNFTTHAHGEVAVKDGSVHLKSYKDLDGSINHCNGSLKTEADFVSYTEIKGSDTAKKCDDAEVLFDQSVNNLKTKPLEKVNGLTHPIIGHSPGDDIHVVNLVNTHKREVGDTDIHNCYGDSCHHASNACQCTENDSDVSCGEVETAHEVTYKVRVHTEHNDIDILLTDLEKTSLHDLSTNSSSVICMTSKDVINGVTYVVYDSEKQMPDIMRLITKDLSEPYSIYTYRYFIHNWPKLCFLAMSDQNYVGAIVCKLDLHKKMVRRGYIAMLAVDSEHRRRQIGSTLVTKAIEAMIRDDCDEVVLETEITNQGALRLYENLGFVRDKRLFRYYLNGVDALRLKLWLR